MTMLQIDLSKPSFRAAYQHARILAVAGDRDGADKLFARLLWHVDARDGGFLGLSDAQIDAKIARDPRLNIDDVMDGQWDAGQWPTQEAA